jgi:anti-sigma B factor antagonist
MTGSMSDESLTIDIDDGGAIVVHGDIDMAGGPVLEAAILQREAEFPLVIDLDDVSFIDSSGLRSLLGASRRARTRGSEVALRSVGPEVARLLDITGTTSQFVIESHRG